VPVPVQVLRRLVFAADEQPAVFTMIYDDQEATHEAVYIA